MTDFTRPRESEAESERKAAGARLSDVFTAIVDELDPKIRETVMGALGANKKKAHPLSEGVGDVVGHAAGIVLGHLASTRIIQRRWNRHLVPLGAPRLTFGQVLTVGSVLYFAGSRAASGWGASTRGSRQLNEALDKFKGSL